MNKTTKGAIAAAIAAALLAGGAQTIASWNDSESVDAGTITAGQLSLEPVLESSQWVDTSTDEVITDIGEFRVVPGDNLVYTTQFTVRAEGDNLAATLAVDPSSIAGGATLIDESDVTVTVLDAVGVALPTVTEANDNAVITAQVTFDFPFEPATNDSQTDTLDLSGLSLVLTQTDATP